MSLSEILFQVTNSLFTFLTYIQKYILSFPNDLDSFNSSSSYYDIKTVSVSLVSSVQLTFGSQVISEFLVSKPMHYNRQTLRAVLRNCKGFIYLFIYSFVYFQQLICATKHYEIKT